MLSFATEMPISRDCHVSQFLTSIRKWIIGSPHTRFTEEHLAGIEAKNESHVTHEAESLDVLNLSTASEQLTGVRYTKRDKGLEWVTSAVFSKRPTDTWVGIKVSCESWNPAVRVPPAKKPILVRTLLETMGGAEDGLLSVNGRARHLLDSEIGFAAQLINGRSGCRLPIVYVSADFQGTYLIDPDRLARDLEGMAHVVVEPNRPFSLRLKIEVDAENVYGGTVGIYWPQGAGRRSFFVGGDYESPSDVIRAIFDEICQSLVNRRSSDRCTWAYVQESVSRKTIETLKKVGSTEIEKYIETFDKELAAKSQRLEDADIEIKRLQNELQIYHAKVKVGTGSLLQSGGEQDLYPNEVLSIVRQAIDEASRNQTPDSRRVHVLNAVLNASPKPEDIAAEMREKLKQLLRGFRGMDSTIRRGLEEMGFSISEDGKHYKLVFQHDDRYTFTLPKSGSDHRGGLNAATKIGKLLF